MRLVDPLGLTTTLKSVLKFWVKPGQESATAGLNIEKIIFFVTSPLLGGLGTQK
jgi:hypothetical protein